MTDNAAAPGVMGVDLGTVRVGIAVARYGNATTGARSLLTFRRGTLDQDIDRMRRIAAEQGIGHLVVGLPLNMDGSEGPQAQATRDWAEAVAERLALPLSLLDERLTSVQAEGTMPRARRGRSGEAPSAPARRARRAAVDREAARLILQAALDGRRPAS